MLNWVRTVTDFLTQSGHARVLPIVLGDALSGAVTDEDGTWPCQPVRDLLESLGDSNLEKHLAVAKLNQLGVTSRGVYDGGKQERSLADKYKQAADRVRLRWPRSGALLDQLHGSYSDDARCEDRSAEGQADARSRPRRRLRPIQLAGHSRLEASRRYSLPSDADRQAGAR